MPDHAALPLGTVDLDVHFGPDLIARSQSAWQVVCQAADAGVRGVCLRSHTGSTVDLANALDEAVEDVQVVGAVTLATAVGGINPEAARVAVATGARLVALPGAHPTSRGDDLDPRQFDEVCETITAAGICLDVGSPHARDLLGVIERARSHGVRRVVVSHPFYSGQRYPADLQARAANSGAMIEHCFMQFAPGYPDGNRIEDLVRHIRAVGPRRVVLSSDSGKARFPQLAEALSAFHRDLQDHFTEEELVLMFAHNPAHLLGLAEDDETL